MVMTPSMMKSQRQSAIPATPFMPPMMAEPRKPLKAPAICPAAKRMEMRLASSFLVYQQLQTRKSIY